ncbi:MAG: hypothetical protein NDI84_06305 [Steroidobacteraceae bacterium]|nr:hypothetical protein [Steroidobacteraceae bacterium]
MSNVTPRDIEALVEIFDRSSWDVLKLETNGFKIHLSKNHPDGASPITLAAMTPPSAAPVAAPAQSSAPAPHAATQAAPALAARSPATATASNLVTVRAPNLGTFYRSPKPGAPPYVEIGQEVEPDSEICLIEVMKLFTTVRAGMRGIVREVCVADSEMVEGEQPLFLIEPRG